MIVQLTGVVVRTDGSSVVLDVGGVGYLVSVPTPTLNGLPEPGGKITLLTHLAARVQPDFDMALYGFLEAQELQAFKILISVSGVGARVALAMLSALNVGELAGAIAASDVKKITQAPGVGPKLAQRICTEIGDKMAALAFERKVDRAVSGERSAQENAVYEDVLEALVNLGYARPDARRAVDRALTSAADRADVNHLISAALQLLAGGKR